jgi:hypothetical protein
MRNNETDLPAIEHRLRAERPAHPAPPGLTERVIANLPAEVTAGPAPTFSLWPRFALGLAAVTLIAGALFHFSRRDPAPSPGPDVVATTLPPEPLNLDFPTIQTVPLEAFAQHLDQPLEKELQNVISDTRQAIQFVAASFLPEK